MVKKYFFNLYILTIFIFVFINSSFAIEIGSCQTLNSGTYELNQSIYNNSAVCFTMNQDNITLDCQSFTIDGTKASALITGSNKDNITIKNCNLQQGNTAVGIYSGGHNWTIQNTNISDCNGQGIQVTADSDYNVFENINIYDVAGIGILFDSQTGNSANYNYLNNVVINTTGGIGINMEDTDYFDFNNVKIYNTGGNAISQGGAQYGNFTNLTIKNVIGYGILVNNLGNYCNYNNVYIENTSLMGHRCDYVSTNDLCDNNVYNDFTVKNIYLSTGISIERANNITFNKFYIENIGNDASDLGMTFGGTGDNIILNDGFITDTFYDSLKFNDGVSAITIDNVTILNSGRFGLFCDYVSDVTTCDNSLFKNLNVSNSSNHGILLERMSESELINVSSRFNGDIGLSLGSAPNNVISFSNFLNNTGYSISLTSSNNITIFGSKIDDIYSDNWALDYFFNDTVNNVSLGNFWIDFHNCTNSTIFELGQYEYEVCLSEDYVIDETNNVIDYFPIVSISLLVEELEDEIIDRFSGTKNFIVEIMDIVDLIILETIYFLTENFLVFFIVGILFLFIISFFKNILEGIVKFFENMLKKK